MSVHVFMYAVLASVGVCEAYKTDSVWHVLPCGCVKINYFRESSPPPKTASVVPHGSWNEYQNWLWQQFIYISKTLSSGFDMLSFPAWLNFDLCKYLWMFKRINSCTWILHFMLTYSIVCSLSHNTSVSAVVVDIVWLL